MIPEILADAKIVGTGGNDLKNMSVGSRPMDAGRSPIRPDDREGFSELAMSSSHHHEPTGQVPMIPIIAQEPEDESPPDLVITHHASVADGAVPPGFQEASSARESHITKAAERRDRKASRVTNVVAAVTLHELTSAIKRLQQAGPG